MLTEHDALLVEGDLRLPSLDTFKANLVVLVVAGDLIVDGILRDRDDPATGIFVLGSLRCGDLVTSGSLGVARDVDVSGTLLGLGNDYTAQIGGKLSAKVFAPEYHHFTVKKAKLGLVLGEDAADRIDAKEVPAPLSGKALRDAIAKPLVSEDARYVEDEDLDSMEFDDVVDADKLLRRVLKGQSILRA